MKKKLSGRFLILLLTLCFMCVGLSVPALALDENTDGSITVKLNSFAEGVELGLYKVGDYTSDGVYELNDAFKASNVIPGDLKSASATEEAAKKLAEFANSVEPEMKSSIGSDGSAVFTGLSYMDQLYLICQRSGEDVVLISPMLVPLRYYEDDVERTSAVVEAKYKDVRKEEIFGAILLRKLDDNDKPLSGATFSFEKKTYVDNAENQSDKELLKDNVGYYKWDLVNASLVTDSNGFIAVEGLPLGDYRFIEKKAPAGYVLDETPHEVTVSSKATIKLENGLYVKDEGEPVVLIVHNTPIPKESSIVSDPPKPPTPVITGDQIAKYIIVGVVVAVSLVAVILLFVLGRKGKNNDDQDDDE